jgi:serine/threonine protein kinase/tetratricopeptide (TPR) repeat protein
MSPSPGDELSHYQLVEKIGEGGMGVVWRALDTQLDREVAIKLLPPEIEAVAHRAAHLLREARAVAALNHPNIVTIHSIEEVEGHRFLVMELVRGVTLDGIIPDEGLPVSRILEIMTALSNAVAAAHEKGIVHRDLKPGNVMVTDGGGLKILDFGMAKLPEPPVDLDLQDAPTQASLDGKIQGTAPYMAPEQIHGQPGDARSDLFALGVICYEMATGRQPFRGRTAAALIASILRDEPPSMISVRGDLPRGLERIVRRAMEKEPERRYEAVTDLRDTLVRLQERLDRNDVSDEMVSVPDVRSVAVLPLDNLSRDPDQTYFADGMTDALINTLARIKALRVISRTSVMRYRDAKKPLPETARELGVDAVVEGSVLRAGDRVRITAQLIDAERDQLLWAESYEHGLGNVLDLQSRVARTIADKIKLELTPQEHEDLTRARQLDPAVHEACLRGRHFWYKRTTESVRKGLECFEEAIGLDPRHAPAYAGVADSYIVDGGRYLGVSPKIAYSRARAAAIKALELDDSLPEAHTSLAAVMTDYDWNWEGADREYRRAIELNPNYVTAHSWYAEQLSRMGRHAEAVAEAERARALDPLSLASSMIVAWILYFACRYDEAIEQARRTLELDPDFATAHRILGWAYEETGRYEDAIAAHKRASELSGQQPNFSGQLGRAYALAGMLAEARGVLQQLRELSRETYVSSLDIAIIHAALGEMDEALDWLERAYEERADHLPYLRVNPRLDPLRSEPRFHHIQERMGLVARGMQIETG